MKLIQTAIPDLVIIEPTMYRDKRGWFMESFNEQDFHQGLSRLSLRVPPRFVQDNHSCSNKGVLRGLHYQLPPYAQGKLVRVVSGAVYDVALDIREDSSTFGQYVGVELTATNHRQFWIPEGFAHAFLALEDDTHFLYKTTHFYNKSCEASIRWNDPDLAIKWPLSETPIVNPKDALAPLLKEALKFSAQETAASNRLLHLPIMGDDRGSLIALENSTHLPFNIERVYYIFDTKKGMSRGKHAHKKLKQLAVCVSGKCRIVLDDGVKRQNYWLDAPDKGLFINSMVWREMHDFSEDCVLIVLASEPYEEDDYIRDYNQFICQVQKKCV